MAGGTTTGGLQVQEGVPFSDAAPCLGKVICADVSDEGKRDILAGNMRRILKVAGGS